MTDFANALDRPYGSTGEARADALAYLRRTGNVDVVAEALGLVADPVAQKTQRAKAVGDMTGHKPVERVEQKLTPRQREILELLAEGLTHKAAAARLGISSVAVSECMKRVRDKHGITDKAALLALLDGPAELPGDLPEQRKRENRA